MASPRKGSPKTTAAVAPEPLPTDEPKKSGPRPQEVKPSDVPVGELRARLAATYPDARPDELAHQLLVSRSRMPRHVRENGRTNMSAHIEVTSATADWLQETVLALWPSRLPES